MKKLSVFALALALALTPVTVQAKETESVEEMMTESAVMELNWSDVEEQLAEVDADFVTFDEISVKMWVPSVLEPVELTDEDREEGYIGYFETADESAAVGVVYVDVEGMSLEEYKAQLEEMGVEGVQFALINGLECLGYDLKDDDTSVVALVTEAGYIMEFSFSPISDEEFAATAMSMIASIQAEEE